MSYVIGETFYVDITTSPNVRDCCTLTVNSIENGIITFNYMYDHDSHYPISQSGVCTYDIEIFDTLLAFQWKLIKRTPPLYNFEDELFKL